MLGMETDSLYENSTVFFFFSSNRVSSFFLFSTNFIAVRCILAQKKKQKKKVKRKRIKSNPRKQEFCLFGCFCNKLHMI